MRFKQNVGSIALLFVAPLATNLSAGIAPSSAATIANSAAEVTIDNFSHRPGDTGRSSVTDTDTVSFDGLAVAEANANAAFIANCHQLLAQNISETKVRAGAIDILVSLKVKLQLSAIFRSVLKKLFPLLLRLFCTL